MSLFITESAPRAAHRQATLARLKRRIAEKIGDRSAAPITIVALGDSVTQGIGAVDQILHEAVYHAQLKRVLEQRFPLCIFNVINAGVDGGSAQSALLQLDRDVVPCKPDLVIVGYGLNDAAAPHPAALAFFSERMQQVIHRLRAETPADIILLTPNMMLTRGNDAIPDCYRELAPGLMSIQTGGTLARFADELLRIGKEHHVPVADVYGIWNQLADRGVDVTRMLANGLNHPNAEGHLLIVQAIMEIIAPSMSDSN